MVSLWSISELRKRPTILKYGHTYGLNNQMWSQQECLVQEQTYRHQLLLRNKQIKKNIRWPPSKYIEIHHVENAHICRGSESFTNSSKYATLKKGSIISCEIIRKAKKIFNVSDCFFFAATNKNSWQINDQSNT